MLALVCKHLYSGYPTFSEGTWTLQTYITVSNTSPYLRRYDYRSLWIYRVDGTLPSSVVCDDPHHSPIIDASAIFHFKHIYESSWVLWAAAQVVRLLNQFRVELAARLAGPRIPDRSSEVRSCLGWPLTPPTKGRVFYPDTTHGTAIYADQTRVVWGVNGAAYMAVPWSVWAIESRFQPWQVPNGGECSCLTTADPTSLILPS